MVWQLGVHKKIVLSSDWAPKFDPSNNNVFICGEECQRINVSDRNYSGWPVFFFTGIKFSLCSSCCSHCNWQWKSLERLQGERCKFIKLGIILFTPLSNPLTRSLLSLFLNTEKMLWRHLTNLMLNGNLGYLAWCSIWEWWWWWITASTSKVLGSLLLISMLQNVVQSLVPSIATMHHQTYPVNIILDCECVSDADCKPKEFCTSASSSGPKFIQDNVYCEDKTDYYCFRSV